MTFDQIVNTLINTLAQPLIPIMVGIALLLFIWGVIQFIGSSGNAEKAQSGRQFMLWGVVALFVMVAVWGLVQFTRDTFKDVIPEDATGTVDTGPLQRSL